MKENNKTSNSNFTIYNKIEDYNKYMRSNILMCIPNNNRDLRIHIIDEIYYLTKNMFYAAYNKGNIRMKYLIEMQVNISMLDMMNTELLGIKEVPKNKIHNEIKKLMDIKNIIYSWKYNEENK